jgi:tRNA (cytidine/uridine-2'-O-)-methyltransferase
MRLVLFQPDIPQNTGTILRLAACLGLAVDIVRPAGFDISDKALRRALMDYGSGLEIKRHDSWSAFVDENAAGLHGRMLAVTTKGAIAYTDFGYAENDLLVFGRETSGLPDDVHQAADARITIPMMPGRRSLNVAVAAAMVTGEALRQTNGFASIAGTHPSAGS